MTRGLDWTPDMTRRLREAIAEAVETGDRSAFDEIVEAIQGEPIPIPSIVEHRREERRQEANTRWFKPGAWPPERKRCDCGAYYVGESCGRCDRDDAWHRRRGEKTDEGRAAERRRGSIRL